MNTAAPLSLELEQEPKRRILFICHNHPSVRPGGAEAYALELHRYLRDSEDFESTFLAKGGPPLSPAGRTHSGTYTAPIGGSTDEYFLYTDGYDYDWTFGTIRNDKELYTRHLRNFLLAANPDIVHIHHTMFFGYDILREIRNTLPNAAIVYTLHEYMPICHRQGQMVRTIDDTRCLDATPLRCHECFPEISPQTFFMRKRFIQAHMELADRFIAPSAFLGDRFVDWGLPREKVVVEEYGRALSPGLNGTSPRTSPFRDRFGFFGQLTPFKGVHVLLEAMAILQDERSRIDDPLLAAIEAAGGAARPPSAPEPDPHAWIHGANLDLQPGNYQNTVTSLLEHVSKSVTFVGRYDAADLHSLMENVDWVVVPSVWWENSPLVIQEAFHSGRPIICSDIGGMAEKVTEGVNGLHFRAGDAKSLARTIRRAVDTPGLWDDLRAGIDPVYSMSTHVDRLTSLYDSILRDKRGANG